MAGGYKFDGFDYAVLAYFISHIPITMCVDAQALLSAHPQPLKDMLKWYVSWSGDPLMGAPATWFKGIVAAELLLQLPFFFYAVYAWLNQVEAVRLPAIVYGAHTATTLIPILATFWDASLTLSDQQRLMLTAIYSPYLLMPLAIVWRAMARPLLFPASAAAAKESGKQV